MTVEFNSEFSQAPDELPLHLRRVALSWNLDPDHYLWGNHS